uniref:FYVE-type domain-containing protein n=1 Tax=Globisporangium ultimum (strain ATCC 200006 / CBS 805.95 / DAOM BR144) TaxID=431595 RepID=K3W654_GLOUD
MDMHHSILQVHDAAPGGIVIKSPSGREKLVLTDEEICNDIFATIPKLHEAVARDTYGRRWKQKCRENGVDVFELETASGVAGDEDLDLVHAVVAKVELRCHLNEVLNVLVNEDSTEYQTTMQALCGKKFKRGENLFAQRRMFTAQNRVQAFDIVSQPNSSKSNGDLLENNPAHGLIAVKVATLRPKLSLKFKSKHRLKQRLALSSITQQYPGKDRAVHIIKTLPKSAHDQIIPAAERSALRRDLDHIAVGFNVQSTHRGGGSINHTTRVFAHGYASTTPPSSFGKMGSTKQLTSINAADLARHRDAVMNPEAKHVINLLTKSLRQFERVIRRRRFGFQSFIYFPMGYDDPILEKSCSICHKHFSFFRRDFFCQLCGHMCCNDCSQLHEVEARIGEVRKNRVCLKCVVRVDSCVFEDEELLKALGPIVVEVDDAQWLNDDNFYLADIDEDAETDTTSITSVTSSTGTNCSVDEIHDNLYSDDPTLRSQALDFLGQLVGPEAKTSQKKHYDFVDPAAAHQYYTKKQRRAKSGKRKQQTKKQRVLEDVENHLSQSLRDAKDKYHPEDFVVVGMERDYTLQFDSSKTRSADQPLPPRIARSKQVKRLQFIEESGVLKPSFDHAALDLIAEVAAKRMNCPMGFISVVDQDTFHAIGTYNVPPEVFNLPLENNVCVHQVHGEKPLVLKNPQRDMRFSQMPCVQDLGVKFYAGFPIRGPEGNVVASLCAADAVPHNNITTKDYVTMEALAQLASELVVPSARQQKS